MATFLELVQDLHTESGASGSAPAAVTNQRGEARRLVKWVLRAEHHIQSLWLDWKFLRSEYEENTTASDVNLPVAQNVNLWDERTFKIKFPGDTLFSPIEAVEYSAIKEEVRDTAEDAPYRVIIMPDNTLEVEPTPDDAYTIKADYYVNPIAMVAADDVSVIPVAYHNAILGKALVYYGNFENAPDAKAQGLELYTEYVDRLENNQRPNKHQSQYRSGGELIEVIASQ